MYVRVRSISCGGEGKRVRVIEKGMAGGICEKGKKLYERGV